MIASGLLILGNGDREDSQRYIKESRDPEPGAHQVIIVILGTWIKDTWIKGHHIFKLNGSIRDLTAESLRQTITYIFNIIQHPDRIPP